MLTKVLEQKWVIRFFGVALILAPFLNIFISGEEILGPNQRMTWKLFCEFVAGVPTAYKFLEIASLVIGALMLRGAVSAWRYLLVLLGAYIVVQFAHLGKNVRTDKTAWIFIGINVLVFFFIADQLVLKPRPEEGETEHGALPNPNPQTNPIPSPQPFAVSSPGTPSPVVASPVAPAPALAIVPQRAEPQVAVSASAPTTAAPLGPRVSRKNIVINLGGVGKWAKLVDISPDGLHVRCLGDIPVGVVSRRLSITLGQADLKLRFARQSGSVIFFEWENLTSLQVRALNTWIRANSAA